jgi:hypothetical protein
MTGTVNMSDTPNTYMAECDTCGDAYPKTDEWSVGWYDVGFCSRLCKQRWQESNNSPAR